MIRKSRKVRVIDLYQLIMQSIKNSALDDDMVKVLLRIVNKHNLPIQKNEQIEKKIEKSRKNLIPCVKFLQAKKNFSEKFALSNPEELRENLKNLLESPELEQEDLIHILNILDKYRELFKPEISKCLLLNSVGDLIQENQ